MFANALGELVGIRRAMEGLEGASADGQLAEQAHRKPGGRKGRIGDEIAVDALRFGADLSVAFDGSVGGKNLTDKPFHTLIETRTHGNALVQ